MDTEKPTTKSEEDMNKVQLIKAVTKLGRQHGKADYILGEVHSYLIGNATRVDKEFFDWFMRQYQKYQKGDV